MEAQYKTGEKLTDHEITGMLLASMFAGHHTSSVTTAWTLIELLRTPNYLDRMLAELHKVYPAGADVTFLSLRQIPLTEFAVKEALRLHPPLYILLRAALVDFEYDGYLLPKGTWLATSPYVSHRIPTVFTNPEAFGPGREEDKRQFSYIAFGGGRHKCLGNAFAMLQVKTIFAILLRGFEFELLHDPVIPENGLVMGPKKPFRVRYRRLAPNGQF
jgi:sterol 14-demethylase